MDYVVVLILLVVLSTFDVTEKLLKHFRKEVFNE